MVKDVVSLGASGGFSGAEFWRVIADAGSFCLRRWPVEHPEPERLEIIHQLLIHVYQMGVIEVPVPLQTRGGATFLQHAGHLWELAPWMPGSADYHQSPSRTKLASAMNLLARFHIAASGFRPDRLPPVADQAIDLAGLALAGCAPGGADCQPVRLEPAPGVLRRLELTATLLRSESRRIEVAVSNGLVPAVDNRAREILNAFFLTAPDLRASLETAAGWCVAVQPCLRDVWHDHLLFTGERVTGLVDFGAIRDECVSADIARLLGSLVGRDDAAWGFALDAYQRMRPLTLDELRLVKVFDQGNVVLSGMNWLRWIYLDRRQFLSWERVIARLDKNLERLRALRDIAKLS